MDQWALLRSVRGPALSQGSCRALGWARGWGGAEGRLCSSAPSCGSLAGNQPRVSATLQGRTCCIPLRSRGFSWVRESWGGRAGGEGEPAREGSADCVWQHRNNSNTSPAGGRSPPRAWDSAYRLFPPRLLHYVGRSLSRPPLNFCPRFPGPAAPS